jgi:hypothetical protein
MNPMKNYILALLLLSSAPYLYGQSLQKHNLFGLHVIDVTLNEGVSMEEFKDFFTHELIPEYEKHFIGLKGHLIKSARGENKNKFAVVWVFATEPTRDYYFNKDDTPNQHELDALAKVKPKEDEIRKKYGSYIVHYKDDWVVQ